MSNVIPVAVAAIALAMTALAARAGTEASAPAGAEAAKAPLRVAVIGLVHGHAHQLFQKFRKHPEIQIVAIVEPDRALAEQYAKQYALDRGLLYTSLEEMFDKAKPQAAVLYTDTLQHRPMTEACARHGVHVMMEKPLATTLEDAQAIARASEQAHIHVLVNYETSWYPSNHAVFDLVRRGEIGPIRKIVVHDGHMGPKEIGVGPEFLDWLTDPKRNGAGALFDFGCYGADLATWLMAGERPTSVTAVTQQIKPDVYPHVDDEATIIVTYPQAQAIFQASWNWPYNRKDLEVYGKSGYAIAPDADHLRVLPTGAKQEEPVKPAPLPAPYDDSLSYLKAVVVDGAREDDLASLKTNLVALEILDAARRSAGSGRTVVLGGR